MALKQNRNNSKCSGKSMDRWISDILGNGLRSELRENKLASQLYTLEENGGAPSDDRKASVSRLLNEDTSISDEEIAPVRNTTEDSRLMHLAVKNLKKFPDRLNGKREGAEAFFGIPFCVGDTPKSVVYLGSNGSGKTSLYSALEVMGLKKSNTAIIRGYKWIGGETSGAKSLEDDQDKYLTHTNNESRQPKITLVRKDRVLECSDIKKYISEEKDTMAEAFYCSDYDVRNLEACDNYTSFLIDQLGLNRYYAILQFVYFLWGYVNKERAEYEVWKTDKVGKSKDELGLQATAELYILGLTLKKRKEDDLLNKLSEKLGIENLQSEGSDGVSRRELLMKLRDRLEEEMRSFPEEDWFSFDISEMYNKCLKAIESVDRDIEQGGRCSDESKWKQLYADLDSLGMLRKQISDSLQEYATTSPAENPKEYAKACNERLEKLRETKSKIEQFVSIETKYIRQAYDDEAFSQFEKECKQLIGFLESGLTKLLNEWKTKICDFFKNVISDYFGMDNDDVEILMELKPLDIKLKNLTEEDTLKRAVIHNLVEFNVKIKTSGGDYDAMPNDKINADPRAYLNTFKFKLFCVTLKMACCCIAKKMYRVNYPLIIDDVFDASDFDNRVMIRNFAANLSRQHKLLLPENEYSLQIIFFTQDDLVAAQMEKGLKDGLGFDNVMAGRIFDYHEVNPNYDKVKININGEINKEYLSVVDTSPVLCRTLQKYDETGL